MKNMLDILKDHFYTILWTVCYIIIMWAILAGLFGFDMFSGAAWQHLMHTRLHGFGGFVFGILILAAAPMYIATTTIIARTKKPLFTIPMPKIITETLKRAFAPPPPPAPEVKDTPAAESTPAPDVDAIDLQSGIPTELRGAFIRARRGASGRQIRSAFDISNTEAKPQQPNTPQNTQPDPTPDDIPLPDNFDFAEEPTPEMAPVSAMPTFSEITFDDAPVAPATGTQTKENEIPAQPQITTQPTTTDPNTDGEFVISNGMLIAAHTDPDFWIADDTDWFAGGKQRPSPVMAVKNRAAELGLKPVLYLAETNILDLDERIAAWESDGVRVVTDLAELNS